jgi:hypothetical protein
LIYPCSAATWQSLLSRGRLFHQSELPNRGRRVRVWLTAFPMSAEVERVALPLTDQLRSIQSERTESLKY